MKFRNILSSVTVTALSVLPSLAFAGQAAPVPVPIPGKTIGLDDIVLLVRDVINVGIVLASLAVVAMLVYGGFKMATAGNTPDKFAKGKTILFQAMWGALAVFAVGLIVNTIARVASNPSRIF